MHQSESDNPAFSFKLFFPKKVCKFSNRTIDSAQHQFNKKTDDLLFGTNPQFLDGT